MNKSIKKETIKQTIEKDYKKYFLPTIFVISIIIGFFLLKPYLLTIITSVFLAYLFQPLTEKIDSKIKKRWLTSLIICTIIMFIVIIPLILMTKVLASESIQVYNNAQDFLLTKQNSTNEITSNLNEKLGINLKLDELILSGVNYIMTSTKEMLSSIPKMIIKFFMMLFLLYYLIKDFERFKGRIRKYIPINQTEKSEIIEEIEIVTKAVVYGTILTAIIQGIIAMIGFSIFGVNSPIFWGFILIIAALIPIPGSAIIWGPISIIMITKGIILQNPIIIGKGIGLLIYGILLISTIDNIIKPKLIGNKVNMHPALIFLGVLGGINMFGMIGIIFGPIIFGIIITLMKEYSEKYGI